MANVLVNELLCSAYPDTYSVNGLIRGQPAASVQDIWDWEKHAEACFDEFHKERYLEAVAKEADRLAADPSAPPAKCVRQPRVWARCMKRYFCKYQCGSADCNPISAGNMPIHPVSYADRPRWFVLFAPSTSVANMTIPYEFSTTPEYRQRVRFIEFINVRGVLHTERVFLEIEHPSLASKAKLTFTTLGDKDFGKARLPLVYPPLTIMPTYSFEQHAAFQRQFEKNWHTTSIFGRTECPTRLDLLRLDRHICANPCYSQSLTSLTRYCFAATAANKKRGQKISPENFMARPRRRRPARQYAGQFRTCDLFQMLKYFDTDEGRKILESYDQGSFPWLIARTLRATASRFGSLVGYGHASDEDECNIPWSCQHQAHWTAVEKRAACKQAEMTLSEITASMAVLVDHKDRFTGNAMTTWGNKTEEGLRNIALFRLRSYERAVNKFDEDIELENLGIETIAGHPFLGVSTDGNLMFGSAAKNGIPKSFEFKNPTHFVPSIKGEYAMQMMLICAVRCITNIVFCIGTPLFCAMMRYDFNPAQMEEIYFPRLWHNHLYYYLEAFLYTFNYRSMPPWLPPLHKQSSEVSDPEKIYSSQLEHLKTAQGSYFIPHPDDTRIAVGWRGDGAWGLVLPDSADSDFYNTPDMKDKIEKFSNMTMDEIDETWRPEMIHSGYFSTIPFRVNLLSEFNKASRNPAASSSRNECDAMDMDKAADTLQPPSSTAANSPPFDNGLNCKRLHSSCCFDAEEIYGQKKQKINI